MNKSEIFEQACSYIDAVHDKEIEGSKAKYSAACLIIQGIANEWHYELFNN